ncbi:MAG: thiamine diphosphokinase [Hyphomicrobiaceae bacterium]|nr:thiamine diphosphokinase [Hyphomicrobiaceae bacterium]
MQSGSKRAAEPALSCDGPLVIVGGAGFDRRDLLMLQDAEAVIVGADGGADAARDAQVVPVAVIGDMDSLKHADSWEGRTRLIRIAEQETTDFEKCLYSTSAPVTVALGVTGRRFDHTLAALDAVARHGSDRRIVLVGEEDIAISFSGPFGFYAEAGERISVHPLMAVSFARSEGLYYPLDGLTLAPGVRTGTSNTALGGDVSIVPEPGGGVWLLIVDKRHLMRFVTELAG